MNEKLMARCRALMWARVRSEPEGDTAFDGLDKILADEFPGVHLFEIDATMRLVQELEIARLDIGATPNGEAK